MDERPSATVETGTTGTGQAQFLLRQQVLSLYRRILRGVRQIPDPADRRYMKEWARGEFRRNQTATDEITIRMMITQGQQQVKKLETALQLARS